MAKKNKFLPAKMLLADVSIYYTSSEFACFKFLQVMEDGSKTDDDYVLTAFAVGKMGEVIGKQIGLNNIPGDGHEPKDKRIQFANLTVTKDVLIQIYGEGEPDTDLTLYPQASTKFAGFIAYNVEGGFDLVSVIVDPSPPAKSS